MKPEEKARQLATLELAANLNQAAKNRRSALVADFAQEYSVTPRTVWRWLAKYTAVVVGRKPRQDRGQHALTEADAKLISDEVLRSQRDNGKIMLSIRDAVEKLSKLGHIDPCLPSGERLSDRAIRTAMNHYRLMPSQRLATAYKELRSEHPNQLWQIDASTSIFYYVKNIIKRVEKTVHYKNNLEQMDGLQDKLLTSIQITDHYTGAVFVHYVAGGESARNYAETFIRATQPRAQDVFCGLPKVLQMDNGAASRAAGFRNLLEWANVRAQLTPPHCPQANGQVENARDRIERGFEAWAACMEFDSLDELNAAAAQFCAQFNNEQTHSRYQKTRAELWRQTIGGNLRHLAEDELRALFLGRTFTRTVARNRSVSLQGASFDLAAFEDLHINDEVTLYASAQERGRAWLQRMDEDGGRFLHELKAVQKDVAGFRLDAPLVTTAYSDSARKKRSEQAQQKPRSALLAGVEPAAIFGGNDKLAHFRPRGEAVTPSATVVEAAPEKINAFQACRRLADIHGITITPALNQRIRNDYPDGMSEEEFYALADTLNAARQQAAGGLV